MTFRQYNLQKKRSRYNAYIKYRHFVPKIFRSFIEYPILSPKNKNKYNFDLYISLGNNCISAMTLKTLNLRTFSFPFDWLCGVPLEKNLDWILKEFKNFLNYSDLSFPEQILKDELHLRVKNITTGTHFLHDFSNNSLPEFQSIKQKYERRCERLLYSSINQKLLFLYIESNPDNIDYLVTAKKVLQKLVLVKEKVHAKDAKLVILHSSTKESQEINVFKTQGSSIYIFGSPKAHPFPFPGKEKLGLALLVQEILQTIEEDSQEHSTPVQSK